MFLNGLILLSFLNNMEYRIDKKIFLKRLSELGYQSILEFAKKGRFHRNTVRAFLAGEEVFRSAFSKIASSLGLDPVEMIVPHTNLPQKIRHLQELAPVVGSLLKAEPFMAVVLLGSRAKGSPHEYSDWDLGVLRYPVPLSGIDYLKLKGIVEEKSEDIVRRVDLINLNQAPPWFLEGLSNRPIFLGGNAEAFTYLKGLLDGIEKEKAA